MAQSPRLVRVERVSWQVRWMAAYAALYMAARKAEYLSGERVRKVEWSRKAARKASALTSYTPGIGQATAVHAQGRGFVTGAQVGANDPHAREYPSRMVPASIARNRTAEHDSAVRYAGMYFAEPTDHATGQPIEVFGVACKSHNSAVHTFLHGTPIVQALDNHGRDKR